MDSQPQIARSAMDLSNVNRHMMMAQLHSFYYFVRYSAVCNSRGNGADNPEVWPPILAGIAECIEWVPHSENNTVSYVRRDYDKKCEGYTLPRALAQVAVSHEYLAQFCESKHCDEKSAEIVTSLLKLMVKTASDCHHDKPEESQAIDKLRSYINDPHRESLSDIRSLKDQFKLIARVMWRYIEDRWLDKEWSDW
jgi:hypothetical protein